MFKKAIIILVAFFSFSVNAQWNTWKDAESVYQSLLKAQNSGKSYFSQFHEYDPRSKDFNTSKFYNKTEEVPYIYGLDFYYASGSYFPENYKQNNRLHLIEIVKNQWKESKAIPSFSWHLENPYVPSDFNEYMGCRFRYGQKDKPYPENHRFVIKEILTGENGNTCGFGRFKAPAEKNHSYANPREWFDDRCKEVADIINEFVDDEGNPIPFIFRLWHECEDSWMWWGKSSVSFDDYKNFFIYTQNKIKEYAPTAQILWGYGPDRYWANEKEFMLRYPGDEYVDIIGYDDYQIGDPNKADISIEKARIVNSCAKEHNKIVALFETANTNPLTSDNFYEKCLLPLITSEGVNFGLIQLWNVGNFDNNIYYQDRKRFLQNSNIIANIRYE